ncbi:hypothetical protein FDP41_001749 [Naegleria fowleri]|uniref:Uncharacterized protein n=1 Tax=Naegleria fowleri TaxID=5763 RepID=A0A6A5BVU1_NAEFO|nr:uncharacterized protein FDP41_001749 [Naegleria fowleri]KAF0979406.1 hypothetical protein FDP41_001749 [Naegleria fowleri]CAG4712248.1 unnamed protein product [Naegleria fowleri]
MSSISNESGNDELPKFVLFHNRFYRSIGISVSDFDPDGALYTYLFSFDEDEEDLPPIPQNNNATTNSNPSALNTGNHSDPTILTHLPLNATANTASTTSTNVNISIQDDVEEDEEDEEDDEDLSAGGGGELHGTGGGGAVVVGSSSGNGNGNQTSSTPPLNTSKKDGHEFDILQAIYQVTGQLLVNEEERKAIIRYVLWFINLSFKNQELERKAIASSIKRGDLEQNLIDIGFKEQASIIKYVKYIYD